MKRRASTRQILLFFASIFFLLAWFPYSLSAGIYSLSQKETPSEILVRFRNDSVSINKKTQKFANFGLRFCKTTKRFNINAFKIQAPLDNKSLIKMLNSIRKDSDVEWAEPNFRRYPHKIPNDPLISEQWHLINTGQSGGTPGADIQAERGWDITTGATGSNVVVAVLDTGINYNHPDLKDNMWHNAGEDWLEGEIPGYNGIDDDNNGYVDDYYGINVAEESSPFIPLSGDPFDTDGHGTHVAGIIGAVGNNASGVTGIGWETDLMSMRFIGPQGGDVAGVVECVNYILDQKAKGVPIYIVNASFGGPDYSQFEKEAYEALKEEGIFLVASAGNGGTDLDTGEPNFPGSYNIENIINVAATTRNDQLATFSNYGRISVHLGAPGSQILSTFLDETYDVLGGTSMAAPQISGALVLIHSYLNPTFIEAKERIFRGVDPLESLTGRVLTNGRLNLYKALTVDLKGPFIFSIYPLSGSPGTKITLSGIRFGSQQNNSIVDFSGIEADVINWTDNKIECRIPENGLDYNIKVITNEGNSNIVLFSSKSSYQYFLPFAPAQNPWVSYLVLTNYHDQTVYLKVMASEAGAFELETFPESLLPNQMVYRDIRQYGLSDLKNILWIDSEKNISVGIINSYSNAGSMDFSYIRAQRR